MSRENTEEARRRLLSNPEVQNRIRVHAFVIYERSGKVPGRDAENWFQAEQEVLSLLMEEQQQRADSVRRAGNMTATTLESEVPAIGSSAASGQTAEERAESQSALGGWSTTEPASEERAPNIGGTTGAKSDAPSQKTGAVSASKSTSIRKSQANGGTKEDAPKKPSRSAAAKKAGEPAARKKSSAKKPKAGEGA